MNEKEWKREFLWEIRHQKLKNALMKIFDPIQFHHWEEDPSTRAREFQRIAQEALKEDNNEQTSTPHLTDHSL